MSCNIIINVEVKCDKCGVWLYLDFSGHDSFSDEDIYPELTAAGWEDDAKQLCPACVEKRDKPPKSQENKEPDNG